MSSFFSLLFSFYGLSVMFAGPVAVGYIIYSGMLFIMSSGSKTKVQKAKMTLTYTIAGLILILLSFPILHTIGDLTGTTCLLVGLNCQ